MTNQRRSQQGQASDQQQAQNPLARTQTALSSAASAADEPRIEDESARPAELAPAYVLLASPEASYVNGEILGVTGGEPLA